MDDSKLDREKDPNEEERRRESGMPGGGAGRKDEVGRSSVYPMSGPHPPGNAEIKGQASWGQGERGAAGYEDHGGSELTFESGQLLGGLNVGPGGEPMPEQRSPATMAGGDMDVPHEEWLFVDSFSRQHQNWLVSIEVTSSAGRMMEVVERRLTGVSIDHAGSHERAYVEVGETPEDRLTHVVSSPTHIRLRRTETGALMGLEIASADGTSTILRFRSAMPPEMLDGTAA